MERFIITWSLEKKYLKKTRFNSKSDTETLLSLYIHYGSEILNQIDGMFAFAILDKTKNELFLARDRAGKKPLFIYNSNNKIVFSSELNALKKSKINLVINEEAIFSYLRCGFFWNNYNVYQNVSQLLPGHFCTIDLNSLKIDVNTYFNIYEFYLMSEINNRHEAIDLLDKNLNRSIKNRLISSDLEVGTFLSGGIDSSLVTAIASKYQNNIKTFTVKFEGAFDESGLAKETANRFSTDHHEIKISMDLKMMLKKY